MQEIAVGLPFNRAKIPDRPWPTLCGKGTQDRFWIPERIPASYEPPGCRLSENIKIKKIYGGTLIYYSSYSRF